MDTENKKSMMDVMKIPLYESKNDRIFCYKFHDVIINLTKLSIMIKFGKKKFLYLQYNLISFLYSLEPNKDPDLEEESPTNKHGY